MSAYLLHVQTEGHRRDLTEQARLARLVRTTPRRSGRLRTSTARLLMALAVHLDDRLRPRTVRPPSPRLATDVSALGT